MHLTAALGAALLWLAPTSASPIDCPPGQPEHVVDLGYQLNQGRVQNETLITFRNVRFAAPPLGSLRFKAPAPPPRNRTAVQDHPDVIPPQAYPSWLTTGTTDPVLPGDIPPADPRTSEDCLFLDVLMPKAVWDNRHKAKAAVLVWIPGGGFDVGWKDASGAGSGLVLRSTEADQEGVILVSINYRLGLFGWMNGPGVTSNAGLLDQRFALEWVQKYIGLFGGDKDRVTVMGESAGAGSIEAHVTAYGGRKGPVPFVGAIPQSIYLPPTGPNPKAEVDYVVKYSNLTSLHALRAQSTERLQEINALLVGNAKPFGSFIFGIVSDGDYVPDLPSRLLERGAFDHNVAIMTGHNQDEGSRFVPDSLITTEQAYEDFLAATFPALVRRPALLATVTKVLYPPIFDGSQGYINQTQRNNLTIADAIFICNTHVMDSAWSRHTAYAYEYTVPPAVHGADLAYTFYDSGSAVNATLAVDFQRYLTNFAQTFNPNGRGLPYFPPARGGNVVQNIGLDGIGPMADESGIRQLGARCAFWVNAPYLGWF